MEQTQRRRCQHRPIKYFTEEERKEAIRQRKTDYMINKEWFCSICPGHNYKLSNKWYHLRTQKHERRAAVTSVIDKKLYGIKRFSFQVRIDDVDYFG